MGVIRAISTRMRTAALLSVSTTSRRVSACMSNCCRKTFDWSIRWKDQDSTRIVVRKTVINVRKSYQKVIPMETLLFGARWSETDTWKIKSKNWSISMSDSPRPLVRLGAHKNGRIDFNAANKEEIAMRTNISSCWGFVHPSIDCSFFIWTQKWFLAASWANILKLIALFWGIRNLLFGHFWGNSHKVQSREISTTLRFLMQYSSKSALRLPYFHVISAQQYFELFPNENDILNNFH